jgi:hypothetical protein
MSGISVGDGELMLTDPRDIGISSIVDVRHETSVHRKTRDSEGSIDYKSFHV